MSVLVLYEYLSIKAVKTIIFCNQYLSIQFTLDLQAQATYMQETDIGNYSYTEFLVLETNLNTHLLPQCCFKI